MIKFLFLDIDGVMNTSEMWSLPLEKQISDEKCELLKKIVDATNCQIILSSSWRNYKIHRNIINKKFQEYDLSISDSTPPCMDSDYTRGEEIKKFLSIYQQNMIQFKFVILDDEYDMDEFTNVNFVHTDYNVGLTEEDVEKAIHILNGSKPNY